MALPVEYDKDAQIGGIVVVASGIRDRVAFIEHCSFEYIFLFFCYYLKSRSARRACRSMLVCLYVEVSASGIGGHESIAGFHRNLNKTSGRSLDEFAFVLKPDS